MKLELLMKPPARRGSWNNKRRRESRNLRDIPVSPRSEDSAHNIIANRVDKARSGRAHSTVRRCRLWDQIEIGLLLHLAMALDAPRTPIMTLQDNTNTLPPIQCLTNPFTAPPVTRIRGRPISRQEARPCRDDSKGREIGTIRDSGRCQVTIPVEMRSWVSVPEAEDRTVELNVHSLLSTLIPRAFHPHCRTHAPWTTSDRTLLPACQYLGRHGKVFLLERP